MPINQSSQELFPKSTVGDETMGGWRVEYELVDKQLNPRQLTKRTSSFRQAKWVRADVADREVLFSELSELFRLEKNAL